MQDKNKQPHLSDLKLKPDAELPLIDFSYDQKKMLISGKCYPENTMKFFKPIVLWIRDLIQLKPTDEILLEFEFVYVNSATTKLVFDILDMIKSAVNSGMHFKIVWKYACDNDSIFNLGNDYKGNYPNLNLKLIPVE